MIKRIKKHLVKKIKGEEYQRQTGYHVAKQRFEQYMRQKLDHFMVDVDLGPVGDVELIKRTALLKEEDLKEKVDPDIYFGRGYMEMLSWMQTLERYSFNLRTAGSILEIGCGTARLIRHLRCIDGIRLVGSDVNADMISWCKENIPGVEFYVNDLSPPLAFAEDESFDLVFAASVFTHIPLDTQALWIQELHRVIRPGGFLLCDVLGRTLREKMLNAKDTETLKTKGHFTLDSANPKASLSTQLIGSWDVFQTRKEVLRAFGSVFNVRDYLAAYLDLLVLQKPRTPELQSH